MTGTSQRASLLLSCLIVNALVEARRTKPPSSSLRQNAASLRAKRNGEPSTAEIKPVKASVSDIRTKKKKVGTIDTTSGTTDTTSGGKRHKKNKDNRYTSKTPAPTEQLTTYTPTTYSPTESWMGSTSQQAKAAKKKTDEPTFMPTVSPTAYWMGGDTDHSTSWWNAMPDWSAWHAWADNNMVNYSTNGGGSSSNGGKSGKGAKGYAKGGKAYEYAKSGKANIKSGKGSKSKSTKVVTDDYYYDDDDYYTTPIVPSDDWWGDDWKQPPDYWIPGMNGPGMGNGGMKPPPNNGWGGGMNPNEGDMHDDGTPGWGGSDKPNGGWGGSNKPDSGSKPGWGGSGKPGGGSQSGSWGSWQNPDWGEPDWDNGWNNGGSWGSSGGWHTQPPDWGGWWGGWGGGKESYMPAGGMPIQPPSPVITPKPTPIEPLFPPTPVPFSTEKPTTSPTVKPTEQGIPTYSPTNPFPTYSPTPAGTTLSPSTLEPSPGISTLEPSPGITTSPPTAGGLPTFSPTPGISTYDPTPGTTTSPPTAGGLPTFTPTATPTEGVGKETETPTATPTYLTVKSSSPTQSPTYLIAGTEVPTVAPTMNGTISQIPSFAPSNATYAPSYSPTMGEFIFPKLNTILLPDESIDQGAFFGSSVGVDRRTIVVGVQEDDNGVGSALVYRYDTETKTLFEEAKLTPSNGEPTDDFGRAVAISDNFIIVGAQKNDEAGIDTGAAYIYMRTELDRAEVGEWKEVARLTPPDAKENERFGISVAIDRNVAIIGANGADQNGENSGAAYIFTLINDEWVFTQKLIAPDGEAGDNFGFSVAIYGSQAVVGAVWDGEKSGSVYVYILIKGVWTVEGKFVADGGNPDDQFGWSVAMWEHTIAVGAFADDTSGLDSGAVYMFAKDSNEVWYQQARVTPSDGEDNDHFGRSVDVHKDWLIISSPFDDEAGIEAGSVYIYKREDEDWLLQNKLLPQLDPKEFNEFGFGVGVSDDFFVASSKLENETISDAAGSVYVYETFIPGEPTGSPTTTPYPTTATPTFNPTMSYHPSISVGPTITPLPTNSSMPSSTPSSSPTNFTETDTPTAATSVPSYVPSYAPSEAPTSISTSESPSSSPSEGSIPTFNPTSAETPFPTGGPTTFTPPPVESNVSEPPISTSSLSPTVFPSTFEPGVASNSPVATSSSTNAPTPFDSAPAAAPSSLPPQTGSLLPTVFSTTVSTESTTAGTPPPGAVPTNPPQVAVPTNPPQAVTLRNEGLNDDTGYPTSFPTTNWPTIPI